MNSLSSLLSTNVLFSKRLCKIGYLKNPDGYPKYPDEEEVIQSEQSDEDSSLKRLCGYQGAKAAKNTDKNTLLNIRTFVAKSPI